MTTEQIDLAAIKTLLTHLSELKQQVGVLSKQVSTLETERSTLSEQVASIRSQTKQDIQTLQSDHEKIISGKDAAFKKQFLTLQLQQETAETELKQSHTDELQSTIQKLTQQNEATKAELNQQNQELSNQLTQLQQSYQAIANRIRGIES